MVVAVTKVLLNPLLLSLRVPLPLPKPLHEVVTTTKVVTGRITREVIKVVPTGTRPHHHLLSNLHHLRVLLQAKEVPMPMVDVSNEEVPTQGVEFVDIFWKSLRFFSNPRAWGFIKLVSLWSRASSLNGD